MVNVIGMKLIFVITIGLASSCKTNDQKVRQASIDRLESDVAIDHQGTHEAPSDRDLQLRQRELLRRHQDRPKDWRIGAALIRVTTRLGELDRGRRFCRDFLLNTSNARRINIACAELEAVDKNLDLAEIMLNRLNEGPDESEKAEVSGVRALIAMGRGNDQKAVNYLRRGVEQDP